MVKTKVSRKYRKTYKRYTRKIKGGGRINDYSTCEHIRDEQHSFPSLLIKLKETEEQKRQRKRKAGPARPYKFYDCQVIEYDDDNEPVFAGYSCENKRFDGMKIYVNEIKSTAIANTIEDIEEWCCPKNKNRNNNNNSNNNNNNTNSNNNKYR